MNQEEQIGASRPRNEEQIVRYLLDQMGQEERSRMDERLSCDVAFFDLAASVEDDMIMRYVRHDLEKDVVASLHSAGSGRGNHVARSALASMEAFGARAQPSAAHDHFTFDVCA